MKAKLVRIGNSRGVRLPEPTFAVTDGFVATIWRRPGEVTGEVAGEVAKLVLICQGEMSRQELCEGLHLTRSGDTYLDSVEARELRYMTPAASGTPREPGPAFRREGQVLQSSTRF